MAEITAGSSPRFLVSPMAIAIPVAAAAIGLVIRYLAYLSVVPDGTLADFPDALCRWDCVWYVRIVEVGYDSFPVPSMVNAGNWAFFPLYPMVVSGLRAISGLPTMIVATAISIVLTIITAIAARPLLAGSERAYMLLSAYLLCGPFAVYFTTFYTETLFFLLTVLAFIALGRRNYLMAGAWGALLSATRIVGVFFVLAILVESFLEHRERGGRLRSFPRAVLGRPDLVLAIFLAPLGCFFYMGFLHLIVGDALAFAHVQRAWGRPSGNPVGFLWQALTTMPSAGYWPSVPQQLGLATLAGLALIVVLVARRAFAQAMFSTVALALPLFAGMASMLRFTAGLAPVVITAIRILAHNRIVFAVAMLGFVAASYFVTIGWLTEYLTIV